MTTTIPVSKRDNIQRFVDDDVVLSGEIDDHTLVAVRASKTITVNDTIHGHSQVVLVADGDVILLGDDSEWHYTVDDASSLTIRSRGKVSTAGYLNNCNVSIAAMGTVVIGGRIDHQSTLRITAGSDITVHGKIDDHSDVELVSQQGSVMIDEKIDAESKVFLAAGKDAEIGADHGKDGEDRKVDGNSQVTVTARGNVRTGRLAKDKTFVDLVAGGTLAIDRIDNKATVRLAAGSPPVVVSDGVHDSDTRVTAAAGQLGGVVFNDGLSQNVDAWVDPSVTAPMADRTGYWWENWSQTYGYVAPFRIVPRTLAGLVQAVQGDGNVDRPDLTPVKAVGGGWSFTDASLPLTTQAEVDRASIVKQGQWQMVDIKGLLEGRRPESLVGEEVVRSPMDLQPQRLARPRDLLATYDQTNLRTNWLSGSELPPTKDDVRLIDTRALHSSLQCEFIGMRVEAAPMPAVAGVPRRPRPQLLFHVEAGITMADLQQLLDHQKPRLAIKASGGSPGATLAGALSTATHGGEIGGQLLVDSVRAVLLIGPGGIPWWIEGDYPVVDPNKVAQAYGIPFGNVIRAGWVGPQGLGAEDLLRAVVVSMGTFGVIYSVVLQVFPQFGIQQIVQHVGPSDDMDGWQNLLSKANPSVTEQDLRSGGAAANLAVLDMLTDGMKNGTKVQASDNRYVDLAINPIDRQCWVVNRRETAVPDDPNDDRAMPGGFLDVLLRAVADGADQGIFHEDRSLGRLFDFLSYGYSDPDMINNIGQLARLARLPTSQPDPLVALLALAAAQTALNMANVPSKPARGLAFDADVLTGFFHALEGTAPGGRDDQTGVSHQVGAIGWPATGLAGRGLEVALDPRVAFTFVQQVLFDDIRAKAMVDPPRPLLGYISIRVCPTTHTLMGMQQFSDSSVMVEVVGYRSPQANDLMERIQMLGIAFQPDPAIPKPLLHWGLENHQLSASDLAATPLGQPYKGALTRLDAFRTLRAFIRQNNPPVFDNNFTSRLGL